jgi:hypothetical protein
MTDGLNAEQQKQLGILLNDPKYTPIREKVPPKLLETLDQKSPAPKTMS